MAAGSPMASLLPFTCPLPLFRGQSNCLFVLSRPIFVRLQDLRLQRCFIDAASKKNVLQVDIKNQMKKMLKLLRRNLAELPNAAEKKTKAEAKMFYFNCLSLLDPIMKSTTMQEIEISRKLCAVIFFDVKLPIPLRHSSKETKEFIQQAWCDADIIEVTKEELEFLCGIEPSENFDTKDNDKSKFIHYKPEVSFVPALTRMITMQPHLIPENTEQLGVADEL